jgi:amino acid transporter
MPVSQPRPVLRTIDIISLIVGMVVGAGIFRAPALVASQLGSDTAIIAVWALGGVVSLIGALCYAELATTFPNVGGEYHFLQQAYGREVSFLYAWARSTVIVTGSIALIAVTLGDYLTAILPLGAYSTTCWAVIATLLLSGLNALGIQQAKTAQNLFFVIEMLLISAVVIAGIYVHGQHSAVAVTAAASNDLQPLAGRLGLAMVFVLLTYGGWNDAAYISAEARDTRRGVARGLLFGLGAVTVIYLLVNTAYLLGLGRAGVATSNAPAADLLKLAFGERSGVLLSAIIAFSCMKSINATIFFGSRGYFAVGLDWKIFSWLGEWHPCGAPRRAIALQAMISLTLIGLASFTRNGFQSIVEFEAPVFWFFIVLVAVAVFVLRRKYPDLPRTFRVPLYPVVPAIFTLTSLWLLWSSLSYTGYGALVGVALLAVGVIPMVIERRRTVVKDHP